MRKHLADFRQRTRWLAWLDLGLPPKGGDWLVLAPSHLADLGPWTPPKNGGGGRGRARALAFFLSCALKSGRGPVLNLRARDLATTLDRLD